MGRVVGALDDRIMDPRLARELDQSHTPRGYPAWLNRNTKSACLCQELQIRMEYAFKMNSFHLA